MTCDDPKCNDAAPSGASIGWRCAAHERRIRYMMCGDTGPRLDPHPDQACCMRPYEHDDDHAQWIGPVDVRWPRATRLD